MSTLPSPSSGRHPRRARVACEACHGRKVRCDGVANGFPCTNCRLDSQPCNFRPSRKTRRPGQMDSKPRSAPSKLDCIRTLAPHELVPFSYYVFLDAGSMSQLAPATVTHLESQGCLHVPSGAVLESFIQHYFLYVQPCSPVVDEAQFWKVYRRPHESRGEWSLLLFQAMLFTSASYIPFETARQCGYGSLLEARNAFYQKAKALYDARVEGDSFVIAQAAFLLSYYSSPSTADTKWMATAIQHAKAENAHHYYHTSLRTKRDKASLKRLWWSCVVRDRTLALAVRRPLQILPGDFDLNQPCLGESDLEAEIQQSEVYRPHIKAALCRVLVSLCQLAVAVTDLVLTVYPSTGPQHSGQPVTTLEPRSVERAKSSLVRWERSCAVALNAQDKPLHSSLVLYGHLLTMYYQSARIALCNHICRMISTFDTLPPSARKRFEECKAELTESMAGVADSIRCLIMNGMADHLPITAVAHTILPFVLLSVNARRSNSQVDKQKHERSLIYFARIVRVYSLRYDTKYVSAMIQRAVRLSEPRSAESSWTARKSHANDDRGQPRSTWVGVFDLRLTEYIEVLRYLDNSMATGQYAGRAPFQASSVDPAFLAQNQLMGYISATQWESPPTVSPVWLESIESFFLGSPTLSLTPGPAYGPSLLAIEDSREQQGPRAGDDKSHTKDEEEGLSFVKQVWANLAMVGE